MDFAARVGSVREAVAVVVDAVAADLDVALVDHTIAVVVDTVPAYFATRTDAAARFVCGPITIVVERIAAALDAAALSLLATARPDCAMIAVCRTLERRRKSRVPRIRCVRIERCNPDLILLRVFGSDARVRAEARKCEPEYTGPRCGRPGRHRIADADCSVDIVHSFVQTPER